MYCCAAAAVAVEGEGWVDGATAERLYASGTTAGRNG